MASTLPSSGNLFSSSFSSSIESSLASARTLEEARAIQCRISATHPSAVEDTQLGNLIIQTMSRLGGTKEARAAFARMKNRDVSSWEMMIHGYCRNGQHRKALELYWRMTHTTPNAAVFAAALESCGELQMPKQGIAVHAEILAAGQSLLQPLATDILEMYIQCDCIDCARIFFECLDPKDTAPWNTMIAAYARNGSMEEALDLYEKMVSRGVRPGASVRRCAVLACAVQGRLELGMSIWQGAVAEGEAELGLCNAVLDLLARCGDVEMAWKFFREMKEKDVVSWNIILRGFSGLHGRGLEVFREMVLEGVETNGFDFAYKCTLLD